METEVQSEMVRDVEEGTRPDPETPEAARTRISLFQFSDSIHVGGGADECEHRAAPDENDQRDPRRDGAGCEAEDHFHAYVRLPNPFQHKDIVEKAQAARARKLRQLRDQASDAYAILEDDLDAIRETGDMESVIDDLVDRDWRRDFYQAMREVEEEEQFTHIEQDREELERIRKVPEDERDADEYEALVRHMKAYGDMLDQKLTAIQGPKREAFKGMEMDQLIDILRREKTEAMGEETYLHTYNMWSWYVGTLKPVTSGQPRERMWSDINMMKGEAPEVVDALKAAFTELENSQARRGMAGKVS